MAVKDGRREHMSYKCVDTQLLSILTLQRLWINGSCNSHGDCQRSIYASRCALVTRGAGRVRLPYWDRLSHPGRLLDTPDAESF